MRRFGRDWIEAPSLTSARRRSMFLVYRVVVRLTVVPRRIVRGNACHVSGQPASGPFGAALPRKSAAMRANRDASSGNKRAVCPKRCASCMARPAMSAERDAVPPADRRRRRDALHCPVTSRIVGGTTCSVGVTPRTARGRACRARDHDTTSMERGALLGRRDATPPTRRALSPAGRHRLRTAVHRRGHALPCRRPRDVVAVPSCNVREQGSNVTVTRCFVVETCRDVHGTPCRMSETGCSVRDRRRNASDARALPAASDAIGSARDANDRNVRALFAAARQSHLTGARNNSVLTRRDWTANALAAYGRTSMDPINIDIDPSTYPIAGN